MSFDMEIEGAAKANPADAVKRALDWVAIDSENPKAWSKLAHAHEVRHDFKEAILAAGKALSLKPAHPPLLFKLGFAQFRGGLAADAAASFGQCIISSLGLGDEYYVDSARVAQARCLVMTGRFQEALAVITVAAPSASTWLDGPCDGR